MVRITKKPEERKTELMDAAQLLFLKKGYEKTTVSDIVKQINVAQGTFYYYFKSKSEIIDAIVDRFISLVETELQTIFDNQDHDVVKRLNDAINKLFEITSNSHGILDYINQESAAILYERIVKVTIVPLIAAIVDEGVKAGKFAVCYPLETIEAILPALFWQFQRPGLKYDQEKLKRIEVALGQMLDRVLGINDNTFTLSLKKTHRERNF